jgi:hypothetical protein
MCGGHGGAVSGNWCSGIPQSSAWPVAGLYTDKASILQTGRGHFHYGLKKLMRPLDTVLR